MYKCVGGVWVLLPSPPVFGTGGNNATIAIDHIKDLDDDRIKEAIDDDHTQVFVHFMRLDESTAEDEADSDKSS